MLGIKRRVKKVVSNEEKVVCNGAYLLLYAGRYGICSICSICDMVVQLAQR